MNARCYYCCRGLTGLTIHRDHLIPRCHGGLDAIENIALTCSKCNLSKGAATAESFALSLLGASRPMRASIKTVRKNKSVTTPARSIEPGYLNLEDAASHLNAPVLTLRSWIRSNGLPHFKPGRVLLFRKTELDGWVSRYRQGLHGLELTGFNGRMG